MREEMVKMLSIKAPGVAAVAAAQIQITIADLARYERAVTSWGAAGELCLQSGGLRLAGSDLDGTGMSVRNRVSSSTFKHFGTTVVKVRKPRTGYPAPSSTG